MGATGPRHHFVNGPQNGAKGMNTARTMLTPRVNNPVNPCPARISNKQQRLRRVLVGRLFCAPPTQNRLKHVHRFFRFLRRFSQRLRHSALFWCRPFSRNPQTSPHSLQAHQQKSRGEISPVNASVDGWRAHANPHARQSLAQLAISPPLILQRLLEQQAGLLPPQITRLNLRLRLGELARELLRAPDFCRPSLHLHTDSDVTGLLESFLSHRASGFLYVCPNTLEATHA